MTARVGSLRAQHEAGVLAYFLRRTRSFELSWDLAEETWAVVALASRRRSEPPPEWVFAVARDTLAAALRCGQVPDRARRKAGLPRLTLTAERTRWIRETVTADDLAELLAGVQPALRQAVMAPVAARDAAVLRARIRPASPPRGSERRFAPRLRRVARA